MNHKLIPLMSRLTMLKKAELDLRSLADERRDEAHKVQLEILELERSEKDAG